jgi:hypothetical protein
MVNFDCRPHLLLLLSKIHPTIYPTSRNQFESEGLVVPSAIIPNDNV